jgi:hypothetical protein
VILASGRSNSIYLHAGTADTLINPGSDAKYRRITQPFLRYEGVNQLRLLESSRHDADHEGCLKQLERQFSCFSSMNGGANQFEPANQPVGIETDATIVNLNETGILVWAASPNGSESRVLVKIGGYQVLLMADSRRGYSLKQEDRAVDLLFLSSPRYFPPAGVQSRYDPQMIVYAQGKRTDRSGQSPTIFLREEGAVTIELCQAGLKLQTFRGNQFIFRKRN